MRPTNTETLRTEYKAIRAAALLKDATMTVRAFDAKAFDLAYELADGEALTPSEWVLAAHEVAGR